jgi:hypothetical protein
MSLSTSTPYKKGIAGALLLLHSISIVLPVFGNGVRNLSSIRSSLLSERSHGRRTLSMSDRSSTDNIKVEKEPITKVNDSCTIARRSNEEVYGISGPSQPEMTSFKSVGIDNMVNLFTGDFSYNIPLLNVDGYPINIFYNAGITMDQEASWVGLGWNLNPGVVNRQMRGLPDDLDGSSSGADVIIKENFIKDNISAGIDVGFRQEFLGYGKAPSIGTNGVSANANFQISYNTYTGIGVEVGGSLSRRRVDGIYCNGETAVYDIKDEGGLALNASASSKEGLTVRPTYSTLLRNQNKSDIGGSFSTSFSYNSRVGLQDFQMSMQKSRELKAGNNTNTDRFGFVRSAGFAHNFARPSYTPSIQMPITYQTFDLQVQLGQEEPVTSFRAGSIGGFYG